MYKLLALDIDGTLVNDGKEITRQVKDAIEAVKNKGIKIVLSTGRPIGGLRRFIDGLKLTDGDQYAITFNGALVQNIQTDEVIAETTLNRDNLKNLYELSLKVNSHMHFCDPEYMYTPNKDISKYTVYEAHENQIPLRYRTIDEIPEDIKVPKVMFIEDPDILAKIIQMIPESYKKKYTMVTSAPFFLEILHPDVNKGAALQKLAEKLNIKREEVMAIGDGENDLSMIEYAGFGVAMENAAPVVKEAAQYITKSNNEHGVAYAIEQLIFNK